MSGERFTCLDVARAAGLGNGVKKGGELFFKAPYRDDRNPSLRIHPAKDLWKDDPSGLGGDAWALAAAIAGISPDEKVTVLAWLRDRGLLNASSNGNGNGVTAKKIVAQYQYHDESSNLLCEVVRYQPKDFRQRRPDGNGGWVWNMDGVKRIPYRLPELRRAVDVFVVEGEKDCDNLARSGVTATTMIGGAAASADPERVAEFAAYFHEHQHVVILADNDEPGRQHAGRLARGLYGRVASVKLPQLTGLREKGDVSDWLAGKDTDAAAEELSRIADNASEWRPDGVEVGAGFQVPEHWKILDAANLRDWTCTPLRPIVQDLIAHGNFVLVAAQSQTGKTLQMLYVARKILQGGAPLYGKLAITPVERAAYFVLEDPDRRIQARMLDTDHEFPQPLEPGRLTFYVAPGFSLNDDSMFNWLETTIKAKAYDVVFLDTYQRATPGLSSFKDEEQSAILHRLATLTRKLNTTLVVIDHVRKSDSQGRRSSLSIDDIKGTGGKAQNADVVILMERTPDRSQIKLQAFSKDFDRPVGYLLQVAPEGSLDTKFQYVADLAELGAKSHAEAERQRGEVLQLMKPGEWLSKSEIAATCKAMNEKALQRCLGALAKAGKIDQTGERRNRRYCRTSEEVA